MPSFSPLCSVRLLYPLVKVVRVVNCSFSRHPHTHHCYWTSSTGLFGISVDKQQGPKWCLLLTVATNA